jgi:hypothetical protein
METKATRTMLHNVLRFLRQPQTRASEGFIADWRGYGARGVVSLSGVARRVALEAYCPVVVLPRFSGPAPRAIASEPTNAAERGYS